MAQPEIGQVGRRRAHHIAFWVTAAAFLVNMAFSAVPTPLYVIYQQRDHFSDLMVTIVYAVYAVGVIGSLFLAGHLSDRIGRRRIFVPALAANVVSSLIFIFDPGLAGLIVARIVSGVSVGLTTATATSYLAELHAAARPESTARRAEVVAIGSNLGGIGFGPLAAGLLASFAPAPLRLPYVVFGVALVLLAMAVARSPETVRAPELRAPYRPQRIAVPARSRGTYFAATFAGLSAFAVFGPAPSTRAPTRWRERWPSPRLPPAQRPRSPRPGSPTTCCCGAACRPSCWVSGCWSVRCGPATWPCSSPAA
jgi:MFS family permease